ncbi:hypothetical protein B0T24DRAFT_516541 [Lasiosphaeria ovina]|uniref:Uncharacterized protein n=1 Tax=Lasiosphaeria ovina TaxID=92902 RepID=A0AAE0NK81_9PEZI|nr:hypothetical protein B0T24DRAFT_516541 [Lasiosphaeria ovina]
MDTTPTAAASMLTGQRIGFYIFSLAAAAQLGYICYRIYDPLPGPGRGLHRSNAVRHRRTSVPDVAHHHDDQHPEGHDAIHTDADSRGGDENANALQPMADGDTVADENMLEDNWYDDAHRAHNHLRAGQNIVSLLFRVSEDNARRNAYVHRGCQCNACGIVPIRGIRYRCANCADFDLCETCESSQLHIKTHIFYKIRIPAPRLGPRQMQPVWYPGDPSVALRYIPRDVMNRLSRETGFERPELEALWEQWTFMASTEWRDDPDKLCLAMDRKTFERYLVPSSADRHTVPNLIHDRIFAFYDTDRNDLIGFSEFLKATAYRKSKNRLRKIFDGYDINGDGFVERRDFLRLFRAYYVLFRQMHRDILEGQYEQCMSATEAQLGVSGRQPLSGLFGRDSHLPPPDPDPRPMDGNNITDGSTGDANITNGRCSVVREDRPDTEDRESILTSLFSRQENSYGTAPQGSMSNSGIRYLNALLNPPTRVDELPALLAGEARPGDELLVDASQDSQESESSSGSENGGDENLPAQSGDNQVGSQPGDASGSQPPTGTQIQEAYRGPRLSSNVRNQKQVRRKLLDRWKRRHFYLDEEEGLHAPEGWNDDEDVLAASFNEVGESSKSVQPAALAPRSRSSSKVRFAEDTEDFETRSNPSTSSRSIPERWGGMDIPDAERDSGKEIFYQVTQQAFNELLDILFKAKEDLAVRAAETKADRDMYRALFMDLDPDTEDQVAAHMAANPHVDTETAGPGTQEEVPIPLQPLEVLLASSGYAVVAEPSQPQQAAGNVAADATIGIEGDGEASQAHEAGQSSAEAAVAVNGASDGGEASYRDPTMPQFRPESSIATSSEQSASDEAKRDKKGKGVQLESDAKPSNAAAGAKKKKKNKNANPPALTPDVLTGWKRLDLAEEEAKKRGGWGRLSYEEFEKIYAHEEASGVRLDYLGTWIDFCIPYH